MVRAHPRRLAAFTLPAHAANRALKQFLHHTLYYSEPMASERRRSATQIAELFEFWIAHPDKLPANYIESLSSSPVHRGLRLHRRNDGWVLPALLPAKPSAYRPPSRKLDYFAFFALGKHAPR